MSDQICDECGHESPDKREAFMHRVQHRVDDRQPIFEKGQLVAFKRGDQVFTDRIVDVQYDKATGEEKIQVSPDPLPRAVAMLKDTRRLIDQLLTKPDGTGCGRE